MAGDRQSRVGTIRTDGRGRKWRKVRRLTPEAWTDALWNALAGAKLGTLTEGDLRAMGYELEEEQDGRNTGPVGDDPGDRDPADHAGLRLEAQGHRGEQD